MGSTKNHPLKHKVEKNEKRLYAQHKHTYEHIFIQTHICRTPMYVCQKVFDISIIFLIILIDKPCQNYSDIKMLRKYQSRTGNTEYFLTTEVSGTASI